MITPETALIFCRFVFNGAVIFLWGTSGYLAAAVPRGLAGDIESRLTWHQIGASLLVALAALATLPVQTAVIGDGWSSSVDLATTTAVLFGTTVGLAWMVQMIGALLLATVFLVSGRRQRSLALISAALLASLAITGHAAMHGGWIGVIPRANHVLHLLCGGAWLGSLVPVMMILHRLQESEAKTALMRFSRLGHVAVALVVVTGLFNMYLIVGGPATDWTFLYQRLLSIKVLLVVTMTALALVNRYLFVPRMARGDRLAGADLARATLAEILLGTAVIALAAWFGTLQPN